MIYKKNRIVKFGKYYIYYLLFYMLCYINYNFNLNNYKKKFVG